MTKTSQEQLKDKFSLVYEYNKQSPLFVRAAEAEIDKNHFHNAVGILLEGLKSYPDYPTAHLMLGKAYTRLGQYEQAEEEFVTGSELINSKKTLSYYINELEKVKRVDLLYLASKRIPFIPENFERIISDEMEEHQEAIEVTDEEILMGSEIKEQENYKDVKADSPEAENSEQEQPVKNDSIDNSLEDLAKKLSTGKFVLDENEPASESISNKTPKEEEIVTETLAKILLSQGKFREAINVYHKLSAKYPEKHAYFTEKIIEIESQIDGGGW